MWVQFVATWRSWVTFLFVGCGLLFLSAAALNLFSARSRARGCFKELMSGETVGDAVFAVFHCVVGGFIAYYFWHLAAAALNLLDLSFQASGAFEQLVWGETVVVEVNHLVLRWTATIMAILCGVYVMKSVSVPRQEWNPGQFVLSLPSTAIPLMVVLSGFIALVGYLIQPDEFLFREFGFISVFLVIVSIAGGVWMTKHLLAMCRKKA